MKPKKIRKTNHAVVSFRVSEEDAGWIENAIERQLDRLNSGLLPDEGRITKGQLFLEAMSLGMPLVQLERKAG